MASDTTANLTKRSDWVYTVYTIFEHPLNMTCLFEFVYEWFMRTAKSAAEISVEPSSKHERRGQFAPERPAQAVHKINHLNSIRAKFLQIARYEKNKHI